MNARVFIGGVEVYMDVCLRCLCGGMMEKQLGQHVKAGKHKDPTAWLVVGAGIACVCTGMGFSGCF